MTGLSAVLAIAAVEHAKNVGMAKTAGHEWNTAPENKVDSHA